ncbi:MAG: universal stress protein [Deltaproteobacteria bacterium]
MRKHLNTIICAIDFSDYSRHTLSYGIAFARVFDAHLFVAHVIDLPSASMYGEAFFPVEEQKERVMAYAQEEISRLIGDQSVRWEALISHGHTADEIARMAEEKDANLVIAATYGRSGLKRLVLGSVTERLMQTLSCPLLVVRSPEHDFVSPTGREISLNRILVGCDFSSDSLLALQYGLSLAQEFEAELHLVHVIEPPVYRDLVRPEGKKAEEYQTTLQERLNRKLAEMVPEEARFWCVPKSTLLAGQPHEELTKYAVVQNIDLIVLGVHGRGLVEGLLVGSTTDRVIREGPCPVLSVRPTKD